MYDPTLTRDDRGMIRDPDFWPVWPFLPLKRSTGKGGLPDTGFLVSEAAKGQLPEPVTLYLGLLPMYDKTPLAERQTQVFATIDDLVDAGWVVD